MLEGRSCRQESESDGTPIANTERLHLAQEKGRSILYLLMCTGAATDRTERECFMLPSVADDADVNFRQFGMLFFEVFLSLSF